MHVEQIVRRQALGRRYGLSDYEQVETRVIELLKEILARSVLAKTQPEPRKTIACPWPFAIPALQRLGQWTVRVRNADLRERHEREPARALAGHRQRGDGC